MPSGGPDAATGGAPGGRDARARSRRRFTWGCAAGTAIAGSAFAWLVTGGTFDFFGSVPFSSFYDAQVRSWQRGTWAMPGNVLTIEGIRTAGRTDMYYGPVPSVLRLPVLLFTHRLDGRLTEPSLVVAFVLALVVTGLLSWRVRGLLRGPAEVGRTEAVATAALIVLVGLGSVLFFLGSSAQVYEEAELWGATLSLAALFALVGFLDRPSAGRLVSTGALATLAVLTRASVGAGPVLAIGLAGAVYLLAALADRGAGPGRWVRGVGRLVRASGVRLAERPGPYAGGCAAAAAVPLAAYAVINEIKFSTPLRIPLDRQVLTLESAHRRAVLAANGGSLFGLKFVPTNLVAFVRPDALAVTHLFPWLFFPGRAPVLGHVLYDTRDWTSSVPASMPALFLLAVVGVVVVFGPGRPAAGAGAAGAAVLRLALLGAAAGTIGILVIAFIAERYLADAMPLLLLAALPGWHLVAGRTARLAPAARRAGAVALAVVALFELATTVSLSLFYQRELGPVVTIPERAAMVAFQERLHRSLSLSGGPVPGVRYVSALPPRAAALTLAVVGRCAAVYQFDGNGWQPVELGAAGGVRRLAVTFPRTDRGRRQPLLTTGATPQDVVAVTWDGGDRYRFSYEFAGAGFGPPHWVTQSAVAVAPQRPHVVQVDLNSPNGQVYITLDGTPVYSLLYPVAPPDVVTLGAAPRPVATTPAFAGRIRPLRVPTPICAALERRPGARPPLTGAAPR